MRLAISGLVAVLVVAPLTAHDDNPSLPGWMAGCWEWRQDDRWAEECWTIPRAGMMLGSGRSGRGDTLGEWEMMRIALDEPNGAGAAIRMVYLAAPGGKDWTLFALSPSDEMGVTFSNAANDYPQSIRYWREGKQLKARISMLDGSKAKEWEYRPMGSGE